MAATSSLTRQECLELDELSEGFSRAVSDEVVAARRRVASRDLDQFSQRKTELRPSEHGKAEAAREQQRLEAKRQAEVREKRAAKHAAKRDEAAAKAAREAEAELEHVRQAAAARVAIAKAKGEAAAASAERARGAIAKYELVRLAARAARDSEAVAQASAEADAAYRDLPRFGDALAAEARARGGRDGRAGR